MKSSQLLVMVVLAGAIGAPIAGFVGEEKRQQPVTLASMQLPFLHELAGGAAANPAELASFERADAWLNSPPLTPSALNGKVVLVDFWTYTCINWRRTTPYIRAWAAKYKEQGLVVVGVHSPEFSFEKNVNNIRWAVKDMRVDYPVAVDSEHV